MNLYAWAIKWGVSLAALQDLEREIGVDGPGEMPEGASEAAAQAAVRLEAARKGVRLFRNNVGQMNDERGVPVRFGLANDSSKINAVIKSADLVGWRRTLVTPEMVGSFVAVFVSREVKKPGWKYAATPREEAQKRWALLVAADGGDACFTTGPGTL